MIERIPSEAECLMMLGEHRALPNIVAHSKQVMAVSLALVDHLKNPAIVNRDLVIASALLHDIAKTRSIETGEWRHDLIGAEMMREIGCESIARVIESHVILNDYRDDGPLEEREIVYYADKRVLHDTIVSIEQRIEDLVERYGINDTIRELIRKNRAFVHALEKKIGSFLVRDIEGIVSGLMHRQTSRP